MNKKNRGFTLIELIVSIAVLSVMAVVLLQTFVVSKRLSMNARKDETVQDAGRKTMEALKGYSFEKLNKLPEGKDGSVVLISGTEYSYEPFHASGEGTGKGYLLTCKYKINETDEKAAYIITAEIDFDKYASENDYEMPDIADVSNIRNVVLEPDDFTREDELRTEELLLKVNPEPETDESGEIVKTEKTYDISDVERYLQVAVKETGSGTGRKMTAAVKAAYTVDGGRTISNIGSLDSGKTIISTVLSENKKIYVDETEKVLNRIYLFLPASRDIMFAKIFAEADTEDEMELYVVAPKESTYWRGELPKSIEGELKVRTNFDEDFVARQEAQRRLYRLKVTVWASDYSKSGTRPEKGERLLELDSTKQE